MSNFALTTTDPYGDVISSVNYLLATKGAEGANIANVLVANTTSGQITTAVDPNYLSYLYQYIDVRYADSADGSVNFSTSPTNRTYFGTRNYQTGGGSSNPADYIWTQVAGGGFGTTNFLYYQTNGGRQIQFSVGTAPPGSSWVITTNAVAIDLDILSASLVNTTLQILYSNGQTFNRNTANVWSPTAVANIVSTVTNISAVRNNVVVAAIGQTISYNTSAQTWSLSTNPSPNINGNLFSNGTIVSTTSNFYHPVSYVDTYANLIIGESVTVVTSGANGANGAPGIDGLTITSFYDSPTVFIQSNNSVWNPPTNANGYISSNVTVTASRGNTLTGQITRRVTYNADNVFQNYVGPIYGDLGIDNGSLIKSSKVGNYYYYLISPPNTGTANLTVTNGNLSVDALVIGPGYPGTYYISGVPNGSAAGGGGEVTYSAGYTLTSNTSHQFFIGTNFTGWGNTNLTLNSTTITANVGQSIAQFGTAISLDTGGSGGRGAVAAISNEPIGRSGVANPWSVDLVSAFPTNYYPGMRLFSTNQNSGGITYFGGGGGALYPNLTPAIGGVGGGQNGSATLGSPLALNGYFGGGGAGAWDYYNFGGAMPHQSGAIILRVPADQVEYSYSNYANIWQMSTSNISDINPSNFTLTTAETTPYTYSRNVNYTDSNGSGNINITYGALPTNQGERGFIPLAYVVTASDPTLLSNTQLSLAFAAPRDSITPPIGTGFTPIEGDTAQFVYTTTPVSIVKTYDGTGWSDADGEVIDGNVIVTGTITASKLAANDIYALTIQSTGATTGSNTSPGFWLEASTGNARFGGGLNVGDELTVGNNAVIGGNLAVSGLITAGNLLANTVSTTTIVPDSVTNSNGVSIAGTVFSNNSVTLANLGLVSVGDSNYFLYESDQFYSNLGNVQLIYQDTTVTAGISGQTQVQGNVYVDQTFSPFVTSQLYRKDPDGVFTAIAPKNFSLITELFAGNQSLLASQTVNDFASYTVGIIETFSTNGAAQTHEYSWAYSLGALVAGYEATATGNIRGTNPTLGVTQFKR